MFVHIVDSLLDFASVSEVSIKRNIPDNYYIYIYNIIMSFIECGH